MRNRQFFGSEQEGLSLVLGEGGYSQKGSDILNDRMELSHGEVRKCFRIMMWDIYEKMSAEGQKACRELLKKCEDEGSIEVGLLHAIALFNIEFQISAGTEIRIPEDVSDSYDFVKSAPDFELVMFQDLFHQVEYYITNEKLQPPEMITIGNIEEARKEGKDAVRTVLDAYNPE